MSERPSDQPDVLQAVSRGLVGLVAYFLFGIAVGRVLGVAPGSEDTESLLVAHGAGCVGFCLASAVLPASAGVRCSRGILAAPVLYALFMLVWLPFVLFAYTWVLHRLSVPFEPQQQLAYFATADRRRWQFALAVVTVVILGPLAEEYAFRGHCRDALAGLGGRRLALFGTAVIFGLFHGLVFALPLALLGLLFGWLRERYASLAPSLVAHALHNGLMVGVVLRFPEVMQAVYR